MIQKKIGAFLFSTRLMAVLFVVFAIAMAVGTFIEDAYSTAFARIYVYNTTWFELIMLLLAINFAGNIAKYRLWRREKWTTLLLHLAFFLIIIGAGVTRYISFEGMMPIREGQASNVIYSQKTFLTAYIDGNHNGKMLRKKKDFHVLLAQGADNHHTLNTDFKGQNVQFEITKFIRGAKRTVVESDTGKRYLKLVEAGSGQRHDHYLEEGTRVNLNNIIFAFNKKTPGAVNISIDEDGNYAIKTPFAGTYMTMATQKTSKVYKDSLQPLQLRSLYNLNGLRFVFPEPAITGHYEVVHDEALEETGNDAIFVTVRSKGKEKKITLLGSKGKVSQFSDLTIGDLDLHLRYGSKPYQLPFSIYLDDFIAEKYPGTANNPTPSYASFKSKVTLHDNGETSKHAIYMNHVLDYGGYRFFQSSFMPDEKGTVLSVNHDWWGTNITYVGYYLLYLGLMLIMFIKGSRFKNLEKKLSDIKKSKKKNRLKATKNATKVITLLFMLGGFMGYSQTSDSIQATTEHSHNRAEQVDSAKRNAIIGEHLSTKEIDSIIIATAVPKKQAAAFSKLVTQDYQGRMKPINTYSSELLRKLSSSDNYVGLNSDQVIISMLQNPFIWYNVPLIKIDRNDERLHDLLGVDANQHQIKLTQFFDSQGHYKFGPYLEEAYRAKRKSQFQKDLVETDGLVNLLYNSLQGKLLRIFPIPGDENHTWVSYPKAQKEIGQFTNSQDSLFVTNALPLYLQSLFHGKQTGDYTRANSVLASIKAFQTKYGEEVMPSETHIKAEILYNEYNVFNNLFWQYLLAGAFMFIFVILEIFYSKKWIHALINTGKIVVLLLFIIHTLGLIARWYISGHAPWSNAYESMIFVGWATMFFGLAFGRKSDLTIASTAFVAAMIMMIAHWNWLDPSIGHLEPVLDSYWIMIHTSVIVGSYGPFTLAMVLGIVSLLLMGMTTSKNVKKMKLNIKELTIITEMALTIGLVMLTIGNFLGGQWANESWGRYWSWDPKETWALISIMIYAFVIHMRLVPGLRNRFAFNWAAILAYGSILMTYFGVNFYLSGLHSYASGSQIISFKFIGIALGIWLLLGLFASYKYKRFYKKGKPKLSKE